MATTHEHRVIKNENLRMTELGSGGQVKSVLIKENRSLRQKPTRDSFSSLITELWLHVTLKMLWWSNSTSTVMTINQQGTPYACL